MEEKEKEIIETPTQILQEKIDELVKQVSELQKANAHLQVQITGKDIELNATKHLIDAKTSSASASKNFEAWIDDDELSAALMAGEYLKEKGEN